MLKLRRLRTWILNQIATRLVRRKVQRKKKNKKVKGERKSKNKLEVIEDKSIEEKCSMKEKNEN